MVRQHRFRAWDDYFIPGTSVLRNKFTQPDKPYGETDAVKLRQLEEGAAAIRLTELAERPIEGRFDYDHMKAIHRHIFQDVYEWAGEERVAPTTFMSKDGHSYYPAGPSLTAAAEAEYAKLADKDLLRGLGTQAFVNELAESWGEVNVIHSFREGNTRARSAIPDSVDGRKNFKRLFRQSLDEVLAEWPSAGVELGSDGLTIQPGQPSIARRTPKRGQLNP